MKSIKEIQQDIRTENQNVDNNKEIQDAVLKICNIVEDKVKRTVSDDASHNEFSVEICIKMKDIDLPEDSSTANYSKIIFEKVMDKIAEAGYKDNGSSYSAYMIFIKIWIYPFTDNELYELDRYIDSDPYLGIGLGISVAIAVIIFFVIVLLGTTITYNIYNILLIVFIWSGLSAVGAFIMRYLFNKKITDQKELRASIIRRRVKDYSKEN